MKNEIITCKHAIFDKKWGEYKCIVRQIRLYFDDNGCIGCRGCSFYESSKKVLVRRKIQKKAKIVKK